MIDRRDVFQRGWVVRGLLSLSVAVLAGLGCRKPAAPQRAAEAAAPAERAWSSTPEEAFDPSAKPEPRVQFVWQAPDQKRPGIWSVSLDGKDLRQVVKPELLYGGAAQAIETPVRSPDGRWIVCKAFDKDDNGLRILIDRKTRTVKTMAEALGPTGFTWTPDSKHVMFYGERGPVDYDVDAGTLAELPPFYSERFHLVDGGQRILAVNHEGFAYYDLAGKSLRQPSGPIEYSGINSISRDGRRVLFTRPDEHFVVEVEQPGKQIVLGDLGTWDVTFGPRGEDLYFFSDGTLRRLEIATRKLVALGEALPGPFGACKIALATR